MKNRRKARELALQMFYQADVRSHSSLEAFDGMRDRYRFKPEVSSFSHMLLAGTQQYLTAIDALIQWYAKNWTLERMNAIDRNILRLSIYELLLVPQVPPVVSINEAVEIAKRYGTDDSGKFINGILDKIRRERVAEKYLQWSHLRVQLRENAFLTSLRQLKGATKSYLVGGFVRDTLCGIASKDMDIILDASDFSVAERVARHYGRHLITLDEGLRRLVLEKGFHLDFTRKRETLEIDLAERDFTIDSLALDLDHLDLPQLYLTDLHGGLGDLVSGAIRLVGDKAIDEDPLRAFRAFRLECQLHLRLDEHLLSTITQRAQLVSQVARERIRSELLLILHNEYAGSHLTHQAAHATLGQTFGHGVHPNRLNYLEMLLSRETDTVSAIRDRLNRHLQGSVGATKRLLLLKLLCLVAPRLGDEYDGRDITTALGMGQREQRLCKKLAKIAPTLRAKASTASKIPEEQLSSFLRRSGEDTPEVCLATLAFYRGNHAYRERIIAIAATFFERHKLITQPPRLIRGDELAEILSISPGPTLAHILSKIHEGQIQGQVRRREQALAVARRMAKELSTDENPPS